MSALAMNAIRTPTANVKNILFATDLSEASMHALPYVTEIAKKFGASVYLCHIVAPSAFIACAPEVAPTLYEEMREQALKELTALAHSRELAGVRAKVLVVSGQIQDELTRTVQQNQVDLIVAGTHGRTGMRKLVLGSVVEAICRVAACPVLTVGPGLAAQTATKFSRILFPTDMSEDSKQIIPYLRQVAEENQSEITVLHVMPEELVTNPDAAQLAEPIRSTLMHTLEPQLSGLKVEFLIGLGDTVETVLRTAEARDTNLIAMGIHNAFLPGVQLRASTVYRIMAGAHCPVLTYRRREVHP
jgi:nucleotide-binding universal stress UspA family protein